MALNRRSFLAGTAMAGAATTLPLTLTAARAQGEAVAVSQAPAFHRMAVGDIVVTALRDGNLTLNSEVMPNVDAETFAARMNAAFLPPDAYPIAVNAYLIQTGDRTALVDVGAGGAFGPGLGDVAENLAAAGISPEDVDTILITHLHGDHQGGLLTPEGSAAYPNAELIVREEEIAYWGDPSIRETLPDMLRGTVDLTLGMAAAYGDRVTRISADGEVMPGVTAQAMLGHTPGHTGFVVASGDDSLIVWGDLAHVIPVQIPNPDASIVFDSDPDAAVAVRKRVLDQVASDRSLICGHHMPFPGFGHIAREGNGYRFVPSVWQSSL